MRTSGYRRLLERFIQSGTAVLIRALLVLLALLLLAQSAMRNEHLRVLLSRTYRLEGGVAYHAESTG